MRRAARQAARLRSGNFFITVSRVQLEDHLGDIIRKACAMNGIAKTVAARAAELSESEFLTFGQTGQCAKKINFPALGKLLGLNSAKLKAIANGWLPTKKRFIPLAQTPRLYYAK